MVGLDDVLSLAPGVVYQGVEEEMVVVLPEKGKFLVLNESAAYLLPRLDRGNPARRLAADLAARYHLSLERARADVRDWLRELVAAGVCWP